MGVEELEERSEAVADADVEAWRQREGVKKDEGVVGGLLLLDNEGLDGDDRRALDDICRFGGSVWEMRSPGVKIGHEALEPRPSTERGARIVRK